MIPVIIGISSGLIIILLFVILKQVDKKVVYGLILTGIGFLYVGFAWTDLQALIVISSCSLRITELKRIYIYWQPVISCMAVGIWHTIYLQIQI